MKTKIVDTNLILRFLTGEPTDQALRVRRLFESAEKGELILKISTLVAAEVVFVLSGRIYGYDRQELSDALIPFFQSVSLEVEKREIILLALDLYRRYPIDYVDASLAAESSLTGDAIASFDRGFSKISNVSIKQP